MTPPAGRPDAWIVDAIRTPIGRYGGVLKTVRPDDLSALIIKKLIERTSVDPAGIDDVLWGCANQAGEDNRNIGRMASLLAGLPFTVPGSTINRLCGSSLDAIIQAARAVWCGEARVLIAGGVESMSRAPYSMPKNLTGAYGNSIAYDTALGWRYPNSLMEKLFPLEAMGETAENVAEQYRIERQEQDLFALASHTKALEAQRAGKFSAEIVAVPVVDPRGGEKLVDRDEGPRPDTSLEKLASLRPAFRKGGTVTAGNSSSLNDGAAGVLIVEAEAARAMHLSPLARIVATGIAGVDPRVMGIGPVPATRHALRSASLHIDDLDVIELNEAFAAQSIAVMRDLALPPGKTNPNGGAIALGHPLGCTGARIMTTLLHELRRRDGRFGLATMCIGVGQGIAVIVERERTMG
ncbi:MAG: acetyl-CoA C-acyltransferase [Bacteroidota bacterium]